MLLDIGVNMVFSSAPFLFVFLPIIWLLCFFIKSRPWQNAILVVASLLFYAYGEPTFVIIMVISVFFNYIFAILIASIWGRRRLFLVLSVIFNLALIGVFKYAALFVSTINGITGAGLPVPQIALPIGISFFTFQAMSYVIDVYRNPKLLQRNFGKVLLYISFFPQLIAGPIVKYHDVMEYIDNRTMDLEGVATGIRRFILGLSKKLMIANTCGLISDNMFNLPGSSMSTASAWLGAVCYTLQIYFDFSGYSDMAIGLGRMFGFKFLENFDHPYDSASMKEFWRKWHISLSTWFKEYLYIPLGGNRKGKVRTEINKLIVFFFTGMWHGASWNFVLWGMIHGVSVVIEDVVSPKQDKIWKRIIGHIYTLLIVICAFVLFRADTFAMSGDMLYHMFVPTASGLDAINTCVSSLTPWNTMWMGIGVVLSLPVLQVMQRRLKEKDEKTYVVLDRLGYVGAMILFVLCIMNIATASYNPFIYFRF